MAYRTGKQIVQLVRDDIRPSHIMTRESFLNAVALCSAIGGSSNAPIHLNAIARHMSVPLSLGDWQENGYELPLLVDCQPAGDHLDRPIEHAFSKLKAHLQRIGARTYDDLINATGDVCDLFDTTECWNFLKAAGYASD